MQKIKCLLLFSGGLDSILASKLLLNLGIKVTGVTFSSPFWNTKIAQKAAQMLGIDLIILDFEKEYFPLLKNPPHGYGSNMNPCLDCHILMVKKAFQYAQKHGFHFIATGEVLGERPFSQNKKALEIVAQKSGANGYLLRPLSAQLLKPTVAEIKGWVEREKLLDIKGRSRKRQLELARNWGIKNFPTPAGGCLLTDPGYSSRLKELFEHQPDFDKNDAEIIKHGRNFWVGDNLIVVGRDQQDNLNLRNLALDSDILIKVQNHPGPTTLIRIFDNQNKEQAFEEAKKLTLKYAHLKEGEITFLKKN